MQNKETNNNYLDLRHLNVLEIARGKLGFKPHQVFSPIPFCSHNCTLITSGPVPIYAFILLTNDADMQPDNRVSLNLTDLQFLLPFFSCPTYPVSYPILLICLDFANFYSIHSSPSLLLLLLILLISPLLSILLFQ